VLRPRGLMRKCTSLLGSDPVITGITRTDTTGRTMVITGLTGTAGIGTTDTIVTTITTDTRLT
jgi:hypothetical protein